LTTPEKQALLSRLEALPPEKLRLLAQRLRDGASDSLPAARQLVAYFVPSDRQEVDTAKLRAYARELLPGHMVPQTFVPLKELPRTPGGKVDRQALVNRPLSYAKPDKVSLVPPRDDREEILARIWCQVLGLDSVGVHENYFELGGDSLLSIRILARAKKEGLHIRPENFFDQPTIAQQATVAKESDRPAAEDVVATGSLPLTPIQHWFFERITIDPQHWNQSLLFDLSDSVGYARLETAVAKILRHHDALRLRFAREGETWTQAVEAPGRPTLQYLHLDSLSSLEQDKKIEWVAKELNRGFDLAKGRLIAFAFFETARGTPDRLLIVAHHLLVDAVSWGILLEDLETACGQAVEGRAIAFAPKTTSFKAWATGQSAHARPEELASDIAYWERHLPDDDVRLPLDGTSDPGQNTVAGSAVRSFQLDPEETRAVLQDLPRMFRTQINDALLTALARTIASWTGRRSLIVDLEGHGRDAAFDDIDLSRTVGWLTTVFPMRLDLAQTHDPVEALQAVKEQLRVLPGRGAGHGRLAYLATGVELSGRLRVAPNAQLCFNYLGQTDLLRERGNLLQLVSDGRGLARSLSGPRAYLLEVNARVASGSLIVDWTYHERFHRPETIDALGGRFMAELRELIAVSEEPAAQGAIPSDFPLANLDQGELDRLSQLLERIDDQDG